MLGHCPSTSTAEDKLLLTVTLLLDFDDWRQVMMTLALLVDFDS